MPITLHACNVLQSRSGGAVQSWVLVILRAANIPTVVWLDEIEPSPRCAPRLSRHVCSRAEQAS